jgi:peptidoglycan/xylan/chitin deacetylase (PgdA/CDA1 family)
MAHREKTQRASLARAWSWKMQPWSPPEFASSRLIAVWRGKNQGLRANHLIEIKFTVRSAAKTSAIAQFGDWNGILPLVAMTFDGGPIDLFRNLN